MASNVSSEMRQSRHQTRSVLTWQRVWAQRWLLGMLVPGVVYIGIFSYLPMMGVINAFKDSSIYTGMLDGAWVGLKWFEQIFSGPDFGRIMFNTVFIAFLKLVFGFTGAITLALLMNEVRQLWFKRMVQTISYLPYFIAWVVVVLMMNRFLSLQLGLVNEVITHLGGQAIHFEAKIEWFYPRVILSDLWKNVGWNTIIYLAALAGIDSQLYEAARVDGAGRWAQVWHITIPSLMPTITVLLILAAPNLVYAGFDQIYLLQNGHVMEVADIVDTYIMRVGLSSGYYGLGTALGLINSVLGTILIVMANSISKRVGGSSLF